MPSRPATARAVRSLSPVAMTMRKPSPCSAVERRRRRRLHRVGDGDEPGDRAVHHDEHHRLAPVAPGVAPRAPAARRGRGRPASRRCRAPPPGRRRRPSRPCRSPPRSRAPSASASPRASAPAHDRLGQRMLRAALEARGQPQHLRLVVPRLAAAPRRARACPRSACRSCRRSACRPCAKVSSASASRISTPGLRAAPGRRHDRHRRRQPQRAGAGDDQHRDRRDQRIGERRRRPPDRPGDEGQHRHRRSPPARTSRRPRRRRFWIGARERCAAATISTICASIVSLPTRCASMIRLPVPLIVAPGHRVARGLLHRHRLAGQHRLVDRRAALDHHAVHRHLLARPHPQPVADRDLLERHLLLAPVARGAPAPSSARGRAAPGSPSRCARAPRARASGRAAPAPRSPPPPRSRPRPARSGRGSRAGTAPARAPRRR